MPKITKGNKSTIGQQQYFLRTASWRALVVLLFKHGVVQCPFCAMVFTTVIEVQCVLFSSNATHASLWNTCKKFYVDIVNSVIF